MDGIAVRPKASTARWLNFGNTSDALETNTDSAQRCINGVYLYGVVVENRAHDEAVEYVAKVFPRDLNAT